MLSPVRVNMCICYNIAVLILCETNVVLSVDSIMKLFMQMYYKLKGLVAFFAAREEAQMTHCGILPLRPVNTL